MKVGKSRMVNRDFFKAEFHSPKAQGPSGNQAPSLKSVAEAEPSELFAFKECQDLLRTRLTGPMLRIIPQLTGLRLHVLWHRPMDFQGPGEIPVLCPRARQRAGAKGRQPNPDIRCRGCLQRRWKPALSLANQGRRFIGQCGATNFCACLQVDKVFHQFLEEVRLSKAKELLRDPRNRVGEVACTVGYQYDAYDVPEPSALALLAFGAVSLLAYGWQRKNAKA
jgi:hypothetical protein